MLTEKLLKDAYQRLGQFLPKTPYVPSCLSNDQEKVMLKLETAQATKSFKLRGALNKMLTLTDDEKKRGVITVSSGNHGIAVAYAAQLLAIDKAIIIVPVNTPDSKCSKIEKYGATLMKLGRNYDQAHQMGMDFVAEHDYLYIDSYDTDPVVYAGQGSIAYELLEADREIDTVLLPIGGGGLVTGVAAVMKAENPSIRIIGVQTESCPAYAMSVKHQHCYREYPSEPSLCEALVGGIGQLAYDYRDMVDDCIVVSEQEIKDAIRHMILKEKIVAEPSSCVVIAAMLHHRKSIKGKNIALVISGSNIDESVILSAIENK